MKETAYLLQAALISVWWVGLAASQSFFNAFQFETFPPNAFWAFFIPDIMLIAALSAVRAYWKVQALEYVTLGAFGYASLYCCNATLLTNSGYLSTGLMLLGLGYNLFLCFSQSLFRNSSTGFSLNVTKTIVQIVCVWTLSLVAIPYIILEAFDALTVPHMGVPLVVGAIAFVCCSMLGLASSYFMVRDGAGTPLPLDQTNKLVVTGPYQFVRNPMAIAGIGQGVAIAIIFQSALILIYSLLGVLVWQLVVRPIEEQDMVRRFGDAYLEYRERVSCWIPTFLRRGQ
ncbi:MAG: isoprenylcysteine carboxylmethyltransferase family protein [Pirellulaceae bacterium]